MTDVDVLIIGAGPVGLSLAIELGTRGIACRVVERNDRVGYNPRAKMTNVRSREHLRRWGIADELRLKSPMPMDYPANVVFATRMTGGLLARFEDSFNCTQVRNDLFAEGGQWVPQYTLEEVLRARAVAIPGVEISFNTTLESFEQDADGVRARVIGQADIRARYLVGADGAKSLVRKLIGVKLLGDGAFAPNLNLVFRSNELAGLHPHGPAIMYWMVNDDVPGLLGPMSGDGLWYFIATKLAADDQTDHAALIRRSTGLDFDIEIVGTDPWVAHRLIAERFSEGRVFLAGDACHLHPPFGGFGMNMGIGDAVDLGWKLAAVLQGWGGPGLLASYEAERRPVHDWAMAEASANYATVSNQLVRPGLEDAGPLGDATRREVSYTIAVSKIREIRSLGTVKGYTYSGSPIVVADGTEAPLRQGMVYEPSAHPGCVAPHLWLLDGSSLYDHFGPGFTLLAMAHCDTNSLREAAQKRGIPLTIATLDDPRLLPRYQAPLALIRPDQHVAWRGAELPRDLGALLDRVTGAITTTRMKD